MEDMADVLSYAKVRASYGANGNVSGVLDANGNIVTGLDYYTVQGSYGIMKDKDGKTVANYNGKVPLMLNDLPNPTMRWEKSYTFETGLDLGFLNNKYVLNFTYYNRHTQDKFAEITAVFLLSCRITEKYRTRVWSWNSLPISCARKTGNLRLV